MISDEAFHAVDAGDSEEMELNAVIANFGDPFKAGNDFRCLQRNHAPKAILLYPIFWSLATLSA